MRDFFSNGKKKARRGHSHYTPNYTIITPFQNLGVMKNQRRSVLFSKPYTYYTKNKNIFVTGKFQILHGCDYINIIHYKV